MVYINAFRSTYPDLLLFVFEKAQNGITAQGCGILWAIAEDPEGSAVKAVQSIAAAQPDKAFAVLDDAGDGIAGKTLAYPIILEVIVLRLRRGCCQKQYTQYDR